MRGIFFEEDDAVAVAARLVSGGWSAEVVRERLAGEDDDEDHPWAVLTDAPELVLDVLVDEHDGWLDAEDETSGLDRLDRQGERLDRRGERLDRPAEPLPDAPRRLKRPQ